MRSGDTSSRKVLCARAVNQLLDGLQAEITQKDPSVSGFNIGMNSGEAAGQTVGHAHVHLIPVVKAMCRTREVASGVRYRVRPFTENDQTPGVADFSS